MNSKIRVKFGSIEIECEGEESFVRSEFPTLFEKVINLKNPIIENEENALAKSGVKKLSVSTIAQKLGRTDGPGILLSAAIYLSVSGKDSFSRDEIHETAKLATAYFKKTISKNLGQSLKNLSKNGDLNDLGNENYSLTGKSEVRVKELI